MQTSIIKYLVLLSNLSLITNSCGLDMTACEPHSVGQESSFIKFWSGLSVLSLWSSSRELFKAKKPRMQGFLCFSDTFGCSVGIRFQNVFAAGHGALWEQTLISAHASLIRDVHRLAKACLSVLFSSSPQTTAHLTRPVLAAIFLSEIWSSPFCPSTRYMGELNLPLCGTVANFTLCFCLWTML